MLNRKLLIACLSAGFAVTATVSILTQPRGDGEAASSIVQIDENDLTLKARNLPIQVIDDAV